MPDADLTVVCAASPGRWIPRARRLMASVWRYAPEVDARIHVVDPWSKARRFRALSSVEGAVHLLHLDCDCLCAGSVLDVPRGRLVSRRAPIHGHPKWDEDCYRDMLADFGLPYRTLPLPGLFLCDAAVARWIAAREGLWRERYLASHFRPMKRHPNPDTVTLALTLAERGITDAETTWVGPETFSFQGADPRPGVVHHFGTATYAKLEEKGLLWTELEARRLMTAGEIEDVEEIYDEEYHRVAGKRGEKQWPAKQDMARAIHELLGPRSVIDVGCGRGWWLEYWAREHPAVHVVGMDGCARLIKQTGQCDDLVRPLINSCDLRVPDWWRPWTEHAAWPFDLVMCVEVAEHLHEGHAGALIYGLTRLAGPDGTVFFSAARPRQKGRHHVNLRRKDWWADQFRLHGWDSVPPLRRTWQASLNKQGQFGWNIRKNAMFFRRGEA